MPIEPGPVDAPKSILPTEAGRILGALDMVRPDRVGGWAVDRSNRDASLEVDIFREGRPVTTVRADRHRKDLETSGLGTGRHGFGLAIDPPLEPGFEFTISARARTADGASAEVRRPTTAEPPAPDRRLLERIFEEVSRLHHDANPARSAAAETPLELLQRLEVTQARLEAALAAVEAPPPPPQRELKILLGIAMAVGLGSLCIGLVSMWQS